MAKNEIRLNKNIAGAGRSKRHQNYGALMRKHNRYLKLKRILYILYIIVFIFLFLLLFMLINTQRKKELKSIHAIELNRAGSDGKL